MRRNCKYIRHPLDLMTLRFRDVSHRYDLDPVLRNVSLEARGGEILCLLGASGSGKTTLLRLAAGLEDLQSGRIDLNGEELSAPGKEVPAENRAIGMVFQDHALFPHLSVGGNIGFGLTQLPPDERRLVVAQVLSDVGLAGFEDRYPHTLSGGQQQRVALARALAPQPSVILLDEPFASIDVSRRRQLRERSRLSLKQSGAITIMVTHDPEEALDMADRIAVMEQGRVVQCGEPLELFSKPATSLIAGLFGEAQTYPATLDKGVASFAFGQIPAPGLSEATDFELVLRPSQTSLRLASEETGYRILDVRFRGAYWLVLIGCNDSKVTPLHAHLADADGLTAGLPVALSFDPQGAFFFPAAI